MVVNIAKSLRKPSDPVLAWIYLMRLFATVTRDAERTLQREGLTMPRFDVLAQLRSINGSCTQEYLGRRLMVTKGNISGLIDRMEKDELVSRESDPQNRRANRIALTSAGKRLAERVVPEHEQWLKNIFETLSKKEQQVLRQLLRRTLKARQSPS